MERRRFLAIVMTVMMVISLIPSMVFAAAPSGELGGKLKVKGLAAVGATVSADYSKVTPEGVTDEDFTFSWSRQTGEKELTQIGTEKTYTITQEDLGYKLELDITPIDGSGLTGTLTAKTLEVAATEDEAKALTEQNPDETEKAQLAETTDEAENNQDSENQTTDETQTDENQNVENSQNDEVQETEGQLDETQTAYDNESAQQTDDSQENASDQTYNETDSTEGTDDSQMKIYTEEQLQVDENGNVQTDKTDENAEDTAGKDSKEAYEAVASVEDSEDPVCDFGTAQSDLGDVEAQYVQITNIGSETLNFQEISPEHFMVADITEPLAAGESVNVWVQPREGLEAGDYDDVITYETEEGTEVSFEAKITIEGESSDADDEDLEPVEDPKEEPSDTTEPAETPDDSKTSDDNTDASLEAQSLDINTGTLNFSDVEENYTQVNETLSVIVTNTGDSAVTLRIPQSEYFNVLNEDGSEAASGTQLAKGESIMFMVQPKTGLTKGDYSDTLVFGSNEESEVTAQVTAEISVKEAQQQITEIQADPASVNYDDLKEGYDTPDSTTVTLTNTGNTTVSLVQPVGEYFNIGELSASELNPGDTAEFTVTPVTGLTAGDYMDSIQIMQTNADGQEEVLTTVNASITVSEVEKIYKLSVNPTELDFGKTKAGYGEAPEAQKVTVTNEGNTNVTLNTPSAKNFKIGKFSATELAPGESATFKIRPKEGLKAGSYTEAIAVNTDQNVSAKVNVKFTVKTVRKAKIADPADNKITGISSEGYTTQSKITFTAVGAGMNNESPGKGDVRYVPYNWKVINTNSWSSAPYTAAFGITKAGTYTLTVVFDRQMYNGKEWENTGEQDTKQVNFNITQAQIVTATPTPQPNGATAKSAVKTGDTTNIAPFVIILVIAAGCIAGVVVYKKKKK
jgi:LPXTG-motif cell wall-anchored protein